MTNTQSPRLPSGVAATSDAVCAGLSLASIEDYLDGVARWEDAALARLNPAQRAVTWGDHWVGLAPDTGDIIFGRVATVEECADRERVYGADADEIADSTQALEDAHARGYRLGSVYTATHPQGDFESVHLCNVLHRITEAEFALAQSHGWNIGVMRGAGVVQLAPNRQGLIFATAV